VSPGAAASILKGVWGQFAPIINFNDFYRAGFLNPLPVKKNFPLLKFPKNRSYGLIPAE
jgi:hypothetical protein